MKRAIICDLDGTLCDSTHRNHYVQQNPKNWDKFFAEAVKDPVNTWCLDLILDLQTQGSEILFVTGRHMGLARDTIEWLHKHTPFKVALNQNLFMRPLNDRRQDYIVKEEIFKKYLEPQFKIWLAIDDKPNVIHTWEKLNIPSLYCGKLPK